VKQRKGTVLSGVGVQFVMGAFANRLVRSQ
jgi:hypothetical protein